MAKRPALEKHICRLKSRLEMGVLSAGRSNDCQIFENKAIIFIESYPMLRKRFCGARPSVLRWKEKQNTFGLIKSSGILLSMRARVSFHPVILIYSVVHRYEAIGTLSKLNVFPH